MRRLFIRLIAMTMTAAAAPALAQDINRCADCHLSLVEVIEPGDTSGQRNTVQLEPPEKQHARSWEQSAHGRSDVGCAACHGGDPTTLDRIRAHRNMPPSSNSASPLNVRNLARTCGRCHVDELKAFQQSRHDELARAGNEKGPTCVTCHGEVDAWLLAPKSLESKCNSCHGPKGLAPRADRAREVRQLYEGLREVRNDLKAAQSVIKRTSDKQRHADLLKEYEQAQSPVTRAIAAGHKFVYDDLRKELDAARSRVSSLLSTLTNPRPTGR